MPILPSTQWCPGIYTAEILRRNPRTYAHKNFGIIILNQPLEHVSYVINATERSDCTTCADGGANRLFEIHERAVAEGFRNHDDLRMPDFICGDLDSLRPAVKKHFEDRGVCILTDRDQYATDLKKSLRNVKSAMSRNVEVFDIVILGGLSGRADQAFSQLHHLYLATSDPELKPPGMIYLITPECMLFLLEPGLNVITTPVQGGMFTESVGIIPIGKPSRITTRGLEWDVTDWKTDFDSQVSTSNHIMKDKVEIETTEKVIFTMEFAKLNPPTAGDA